MDLEEYMQRGRRAYEDHLRKLREAGFSADFTQTGGLCGALEVVLERGYVLITDVEDELPLSVGRLHGWLVGLYRSDDCSEGPVFAVDTDSATTDALLGSLKQCLREGASSLAA